MTVFRNEKDWYKYVDIMNRLFLPIENSEIRDGEILRQGYILYRSEPVFHGYSCASVTPLSSVESLDKKI